MRRRLFNFAAAASLVLCMGTAGWWHAETRSNGTTRMSKPGPISCELMCDRSRGGLVAKLSFMNTSKARVLVWRRNLLTDNTGKLTWSPFEITLNGSKIEYHGTMVKRPAPTLAEYVSLQPGEVIRTAIDISSDYDLSEKGVYRIYYMPVNMLPDGTNFFEITSNIVEITVK